LGGSGGFAQNGDECLLLGETARLAFGREQIRIPRILAAQTIRQAFDDDTGGRANVYFAVAVGKAVT
jgi:hypothetical protein